MKSKITKEALFISEAGRHRSEVDGATMLFQQSYAPLRLVKSVVLAGPKVRREWPRLSPDSPAFLWSAELSGSTSNFRRTRRRLVRSKILVSRGKYVPFCITPQKRYYKAGPISNIPYHQSYANASAGELNKWGQFKKMPIKSKIKIPATSCRLLRSRALRITSTSLSAGAARGIVCYSWC